MLLSRDADGKLGPVRRDRRRSTSPATTTRACRAPARSSTSMVDALRAVGIDVYQIDHEDANGQFEVNFTYADALKTADNFIFFKMAASEIAREHGMIATFMPKPFSNRTGSGAHFHISIGDAKHEEPVPRRQRQAAAWGCRRMAYHFLGGILAHARALTAVCAPTVNSYKRLVVGRALSGATWAPAYIAYGDNNRTACVRIPGGRLELRLPDSGCNPYLATAAILAAGLDGIDRKLDPGKPNNTNLYELSAAAARRAQASRCCRRTCTKRSTRSSGTKSSAARSARSSSKEFITLKRMEWIEYSRHVSDWETQSVSGVLLMCGDHVRHRRSAAQEARAARRSSASSMAPMLIGMTERGPGFGRRWRCSPSRSRTARASSACYCAASARLSTGKRAGAASCRRQFDGEHRARRHRQSRGADRPSAAPTTVEALARRARARSSTCCRSAARIDLYKDIGAPAEIAQRYGFAELHGHAPRRRTRAWRPSRR